MQILWLPHQDWNFVRRGQREHRFAERLKQSNDVQFLTWHKPTRHPVSVLRSLRSGLAHEEGLVIHQAPRVPNFLGRRVHEKSGSGLRMNELLYQRAVRRIVAHKKVDVVICGIGHQAIGLPPDDLPVPLVFDYLDYKLERWPDIEAEYLRLADAVLCTSKVLLDRVRRVHPHGYHLSNGVALETATTGDGEKVRRTYALEDAKVVSLIGVTASDRLFHVDAVAAAAQTIDSIAYLLVGDGGELGRSIERRAAELGLRTVATGPIPASEVADFYAATDVGLYPGDQNAYFDAASPLKVLEYTAARKPVVATDLAELRNWDFPNVHLARPTADAFANEIVHALEQPVEYPDLSHFSWAWLSGRLLSILDEVVARGKRRPLEQAA